MEEVAGYITFQTKIDDKYFKDGIKKAEKEIEKFQKEEEKLNQKKTKAEVDLSDYKEEVRILSEQHEENMRLAKDEESRRFETRGTQVVLDNINKKYEKQISTYNEIIRKEKENNKNKKDAKKNLDDIVEKYEEWAEKQQQVNNEEKKVNEETKKIENSHNKVSFGLDGLFKKVTRWALAIFSVRSAYSLISRSISTLSQSNTKLKNDIEYMRWAIAKTLEPIVKRIVEWAFKLMQAINYIVYKITGVKIFGEATANNFKKANKSAKELQKTVAGFDEMNTVSSNNSSGNNYDVSGDLNDFGKLSEGFKEKLDKIVAFLKPIYDFIKENIIPVLKELWDDVLVPIWNEVLKPIGEWLLKNPAILVGLISTILGFKLVNKVGNLSKALGGVGKGGLIGGLAILDYYLVSKIVKDVKEKLIPTIKETHDAMVGASNMISSGEKKTEKYTKAVKDNKEALKKDNEKLKQNVDFMFQSISTNYSLNNELSKKLGIEQRLTGEYDLNTQQIKTNNRENKNLLDTLTNLYNEGMLNEQQVNRYKTALQLEINTLETANTKLNKNSQEYGDNKKRIEELKTQLDKTKGDYNVNLKTKTDKKKVDEFGNSINKVTGNHKVKLSAETKDANKSIRDWINKIGKSMFGYLFPKLNFDSVLKKFGLAKGGIVNLPGRGVPIAGERGMEGVIPLTDERQMELLGEAIGKYISVNLTNITKLDSREIARTTNQVQNENSFIRNR